MKIEISRYHDFSYGHRVFGHESKCKDFHGHNGRVTFYATADKLDDLGRIVDFGVLKSILCQWIEENWDHKFLMWKEDIMRHIDIPGKVLLPFNPTAENMAAHLLETGNRLMKPHNIKITKVTLEETRKCAATCHI